MSLNCNALDLLQPKDPRRSNMLNTLATALFKLFDVSKELPHVDKAIELLREASALPQCNRPLTLSNLSACLQVRFELSSQPMDLEEAVLLNREALDLLPNADEARLHSVTTLCSPLLTRFAHLGQLSDVDDAVVLQREYLVLNCGQISDKQQAALPMSLSEVLYKRYTTSARDQ